MQLRSSIPQLCFSGALTALAIGQNLIGQNLVAQNLIALTADNRLVPVRVSTPLSVGPSTPITGLQPGESLLAIDFRPATGQLYGLGSLNRIYVVNPATGSAMPVGAPLATPLQGAEFGFDFNPTVDRIRIVSDTAQNLRVHPDTGAVVAVDGSLAFAVGDVNNGTPPAVAGSGYTNSVAGATSTLLYGIDAGVDALVTQVPPNSGTLNTIGSLGRDVTTVAGFDLAPNGVAYAAMNTAGASNGTSQLFSIDLSSGAATWIGVVPNANASARLRGLAVVPPRAQAQLVALSADGRLATFDSEAPWLAPGIAVIQGLAPGEHIVGIDFRPATGELYGMGSGSQLYRLDVQTGAATAVGSPFATLLNGAEFGFDFNPTVDRIRIVSDADQNLRAHPDTGALVAVDGALAYAAGDPNAGMDASLAASAYTNNLPGATSTLLYGIDANLDVLVTQNPPNSGVLNTVGALGSEVTGVGGFDIASDGRAFAALTTTAGSKLYRVDLATGGLAELANLGLAVGSPIRGLAVRNVAGLAAFGMATPGCAGPAWLGASGQPYAGNLGFAVVTHRAPANTIGFLGLSIVGLSTPVNLSGLLVWIDLNHVVWMRMQTTDAFGTATVASPLQGAWFGLNLHYQWVGFDMCGPLGLAGTAGLRVIVQ